MRTHSANTRVHTATAQAALGIPEMATFTEITGTAESDFITGTLDNDRISGLSGDDTLVGDSGDDRLLGQDGNDGLDGGDGTDVLLGGNGDDGLDGGNGNDFLFGQAGNDGLGGRSGNDLLDGGPGQDFLWGMAGNDQISGGADRDFLFGDEVRTPGAGNDILDGGSGPDEIYGAAGNDRLTGGDGNDYLTGQSGSDVLNGSGGTDTLNGSYGTDRLNGDAGDDLLLGGSGSDCLRGGSGSDVAWAGPGRDVAWGGDGNDRMFGQGGDDALYGGSGNDFLQGGSGTNWEVQSVTRNGLGQPYLEVAFDGDTVVSGGLNIVTVADVSTGRLMATITPANPSSVSVLGPSVSVSGDRLVVGTFFEVSNGPLSDFEGAAYIHDTDGTLLHVLENPDQVRSPLFGSEVAIVGDRVFVGSAGGGQPNAPVYEFDANTGALVRTLENPDSRLGGSFGNDIVASGNTVAISAPGRPAGEAVYLFDIETGDLTHRLRPPSDDPSADEGFGRNSLDIEGDRVIVGQGSLASVSSPSVHTYDTETGERLATYGSPAGSVSPQVAVGEDVAIIATPMSAVGEHIPGQETFALLFNPENEDLRGAIVNQDEGFAGPIAFSDGRLAVALSANESEETDWIAVLAPGAPGGSGRDILEGGEGADRLEGDDGNDRMFGQAGNDQLNGGAGNDVLSGGAGRDVYEFMLGWGDDTVADFGPQDKLHFLELGSVHDLLVRQTEAGMEISHDEDSITLVGITGGLQEDWLVFG
jgi:hypothetical protein